MSDKKRQLLYKYQADIAKAIAHPVRLAIIDFLRQGPRCVCDIAHHIGQERSNVSRHLAVLVSAGILESHKRGLKVIYKIKAPCVFEFLRCVTHLLKDQARESQKLLEVM